MMSPILLDWWRDFWIGLCNVCGLASASTHFEAGFGTKCAAELRTPQRGVVARQFTPAAQSQTSKIDLRG
jgi:hypothetical protein